MKLGLCAAFALFVPSVAMASDYLLSLEETGLREYYCQITVSLTNTSEDPLTEISGYFYSYVSDERVGRSKGSWFMNVQPGETAQAVFETPNAPCDEISRYDFVVGACRLGASFEDVSMCLGRFKFEKPLSAPAPSS